MPELGPDRTALIVVDMQNGFCHEDGSMSRLGANVAMCGEAIPGCRRLIDAAHESAVPVIYLQASLRADYSDGGLLFNQSPILRECQALVTGTWDAAIVDELTPEPRDYVVHKNRYNGFYATMLESILSSLRIETLVVCGVTTCICVETTVREAAQRNYRCFVPRDAVGEVDPALHEASLHVMERTFASLVDADKVIGVWSASVAAATSAEG